ncbi:hypothetical protein M8C13_05730 [Crossiella sp. SN42]|uniref:hypothetical protein n=1 Tax=Crossiella sp. SN42 TaxID=2944808 RepID=UPI00207C3CEC|nr:hypothetical protein [Crossiella sp. SN42]MCO1575258.1 hypothetical protein [Crossiella sp. SN42]
MSHTTRLTRGLLALATLGALVAAPAAAATPAPAPAPGCAQDAAAGPCTDDCLRKRTDGRRSCDLRYDQCRASGQPAARCQDLFRTCTAAVDNSYRLCLQRCTRRADGQVADM